MHYGTLLRFAISTTLALADAYTDVKKDTRIPLDSRISRRRRPKITMR